MATVDVSSYPPIDKEYLFFCIRETLWSKYVVRFNSNNELTVYLKDEYFHTDRMPHFKGVVKYLYCQLDSREEMLEYILILTNNSDEYPFLPYTESPLL